MRHTRRKRRIERIYIKRDVHRRIKFKFVVFVVASHLHCFHPKSFHLFTLMRIDCSDAYLDKTLYQFVFHDACKRRSVGITIGLKIMVEVGMRIEMQNTQVTVFPVESFDYWVGDRMVAAKSDG